MAQGGREERTNKTQNMVSISWYLPEKVRDEMSKTQQFQISENIFSKPALIHTFTCIYIYGQWHKEGEKREQTKHKTWFPLVGTCQKKCGVKCQKHNTFKFSKKYFSKTALMHTFIYVYIRTEAQRKRRENKQNTKHGFH